MHERGRRTSEATGELWVLSWHDFGLANAYWHVGRTDEALRHSRDSLRGKRHFGDPMGIAAAVELVAWIAAAADGERAAVTLGAAQRCFDHLGLPFFPSRYFSVPHEECVATTRRLIGNRAFEAAYRRGCAFTPEQAVSYALGEKAQATSHAEKATEGTLTGRELEVAELIAEGLSNKQIATKLMITQRTAEMHTEHILAKLGCGSRTQIASWVLESKQS
jgi:DNA-binding CsgD family transcriptional regulator